LSIDGQRQSGDRVFTQPTPTRRCEHSTALRALPLVSPCLSRQAGVHDFRKPVQGLAHALDLFCNRRFLCDDLFHHRVTGQRSASAQPSYPAETSCSQCAARRETHTADNARNDEQAYNYQEEQCIHRAVSFLSRVGCRCLMRSAVNSRLTPTPCLPAQVCWLLGTSVHKNQRRVPKKSRRANLAQCACRRISRQPNRKKTSSLCPWEENRARKTQTCNTLIQPLSIMSAKLHFRLMHTPSMV